MYRQWRTRYKEHQYSRNLVKHFFKKFTKETTFLTGSGKINKIVDVDKKNIYIETEKSHKPFAIPMSKIKSSASYFFYRRTVIRKDLEQIYKFNSALLGLLAIIFDGMAKVLSNERGKLRLTLKGCQFYFSGLEKAASYDWNALYRNKVNTILMSYFYLRDMENGKWKERVRNAGMRLLVDCGFFTVMNKQEEIWNLLRKWEKDIEKHGFDSFSKTEKHMKYEIRLKKLIDYKPLNVYEYAAFINRNKEFIYAYFNLDAFCPKETAENYRILEQETGMKPIPVWHCNTQDPTLSDWNALATLVEEGHDVIALGATVKMRNEDKKRSLFQEVFKRHPLQNFHWLGGASHLMLEFDFFSADSQAWTNGRKLNKEGASQIYTMQGPNQATERTKEGTDLERLDYNVKMLSSVHKPDFNNHTRDLFKGKWYSYYKNVLLGGSMLEANDENSNSENSTQISLFSENKANLEHQLSLFTNQESLTA